MTWVAIAMTAALACGCDSPSAAPVDGELDTYNSTGRLAFDDGQMQQAARSYAKALGRAREMDDPVEIATGAYNLAIIKAALGDDADALALLDEADYDSKRANLIQRAGSDQVHLNPTNIQLARARINLLKKDFSEATRCADRVLSEPSSGATDAQRLQAHISKGLAACRMQNASEAAQELDAARKLQITVTGPAAGAMVAGLDGEIRLLQKQSSAAASAFDLQAELSREAHDYRTMCRALAMAGRAYVECGEKKEAADRLYRAAEATLSRDDLQALPLARQAADAAMASGDTVMIRLTKSLLTTAIACTQPASNEPASAQPKE
jgi:tetratricopeptide (TPR) repeat protein